jgi:hypothetical protein
MGATTDQAFVIMQIGDDQLERAYDRAIAPALRDCGLQPQRVDRHNQGGLLYSEIISFIEESDVIVADLTNERPNCYLEIGYAIGTRSMTRLVLSAREDHHADSPNYRSDGPKVHFDLSGYDILFWHPERLGTFRAELRKRVQRRQLLLDRSAE